MYEQKYLKYELSDGTDPIDPINFSTLPSIQELFHKYSEIRYQNKTLYEIEEQFQMMHKTK